MRLLLISAPPGGDAFVECIGVVASAALGQLWLPIEHVNDGVVGVVLLGGVVADGPAVGWVLAERELQGADHCGTPLAVAIFWSGRCICVGYCSEQSAFGALNNAKST